jgi:hypothetical protein
MVTVTYNEAADAVLGEYNYISWFDWNNAWIQPTEAPATERADGKVTRTYEFRYNKVVDATDVDKDLEALFTEIQIPGELTGEELATLENLKIDIIAHAIQADGFADSDAAWAAFN